MAKEHPFFSMIYLCRAWNAIFLLLPSSSIASIVEFLVLIQCALSFSYLISLLFIWWPGLRLLMSHLTWMPWERSEKKQFYFHLCSVILLIYLYAVTADCSRSLFHCILYDSAVTNDSQRPIQMCPIIVRRNCAIDFANVIEMDIDFLSDFSTSVHFSPRSTSSYSVYGATFCVCAFKWVTHYLDWCIRNGSSHSYFFPLISISDRNIGVEIYLNTFYARRFKRLACCNLRNIACNLQLKEHF